MRSLSGVRTQVLKVGSGSLLTPVVTLDDSVPQQNSDGHWLKGQFTDLKQQSVVVLLWLFLWPWIPFVRRFECLFPSRRSLWTCLISSRLTTQTLHKACSYVRLVALLSWASGGAWKPLSEPEPVWNTGSTRLVRFHCPRNPFLIQHARIGCLIFSTALECIASRTVFWNELIKIKTLSGAAFFYLKLRVKKEE